MKHTLNITGTKGVTYDLDEIKKDSRINGSIPLVAQIFTYREGESANPKNPPVGSLWLSKKIK